MTQRKFRGIYFWFCEHTTRCYPPAVSEPHDLAIIGGYAAELIGQVTLASKLCITTQQFSETIFAHPTLSEALLKAAEGSFGTDSHPARR